MRELQKLEDGVMLRYFILQDGKEVEFKLAVIREKSMFRDTYEYSFAYVNEEHTLYTDGGYSGGITGIGVSKHNIRSFTKPDSGSEFYRAFEFVTDEMEIVESFIESETEKRRLAAEDKTKKIELDIERINTLPKEMPIHESFTYKWVARRSEVDYRPVYSARYKPFVEIYRIRKETGGESSYDLKYSFYRKDGVMRKKKIRENLWYLFGDDVASYHGESAVEFIVEALEVQNEFRKLIAQGGQ